MMIQIAHADDNSGPYLGLCIDSPSKQNLYNYQNKFYYTHWTRIPENEQDSLS